MRGAGRVSSVVEVQATSAKSLINRPVVNLADLMANLAQSSLLRSSNAQFAVCGTLRSHEAGEHKGMSTSGGCGPFALPASRRARRGHSELIQTATKPVTAPLHPTVLARNTLQKSALQDDRISCPLTCLLFPLTCCSLKPGW
jgi:hypothetical protein